MLKPDKQNYPKLHAMADDIITLENLVIVLEQRIVIIKKDRTTDEKSINDNKITVIKTKLEIRSLNKAIEEKKRKYEGLTEALKNILPEMELNYDDYLERAKSSDNESIRNVTSMTLATDEDRLDLYMTLKDIYGKEDAKSETNSESESIRSLN